MVDFMERAFPNPHYEVHKGMTLIDWFAGMALQAAIQAGAVGHLAGDLNTSNEEAEQCLAKSSYRVAEAMMKERAARYAKKL